MATSFNGALVIREQGDRVFYEAKWRDSRGRQVKRRVGVFELVGLAVSEHGVQHVHAAPSARCNTPPARPSTPANAPNARPTTRPSSPSRGRLEEDALAGIVAAAGALETADLARLLEHRREAADAQQP